MTLCASPGCGVVLSRYRAGESLCSIHIDGNGSLDPSDGAIVRIATMSWPAWTQDAACRGMDPDRFDVELPSDMMMTDPALAAKRVCASCPVCRACLDYAFALEAQSSELASYREVIFGGLTGRERMKLAERPDRLEAGEALLVTQRLVFRLDPIALEEEETA